jgi:hypothetical protein
MVDTVNYAYFAKLDADNTVVNILVVGKDVLVDDQGVQLEYPESDVAGQQFLQSIFGPDAVCKQTDYNTPPAYRAQTAMITGKYDPVKDEFYMPIAPATETDGDVQPSQLF